MIKYSCTHTVPIIIHYHTHSLCFAVPMGLAIFPQRRYNDYNLFVRLSMLVCIPSSSMSVSQLEPEVRESVLRVAPNTTTVYYNKGL